MNRTLLLLILLALLPGRESFAASTTAPSQKKRPQTKPWSTFEGCTYVTNPNNDGDSFRVQCGKKSFHVRLYFVDAPETNLSDRSRVAEQGQHFGLTTNETIQAGVKAAEATRLFLKRPFTVHTRWTVAGGRSREPRYYAFIEIGNGSLAEHLVEQGWARAKGSIAPAPTGETSKSITARLQRLESEARQRRVGAWGMRPASDAVQKTAAPRIKPRRR